MSEYSNELEQFIYQVCYDSIWNSVSRSIKTNTSLLNLSRSRIKYPDEIILRDMLLESTSNIQIDEDYIVFDAAVSCTIELRANDEVKGNVTTDINQWFMLSCVATVTDQLDNFEVKSITRFQWERKPVENGVSASRNIVPKLRQEDLDAEATKFLERYYPDALETPMPVPIEDIAEAMGLDIKQSYRITEDFSVIGEICFSEGQIPVWDLFKCVKSPLEVKRGTILVDACTYWEQNLGRVKNTIAHEVYHWHRHRLYAAVKQILSKEPVIACRCPSEMVYPEDHDVGWTDEQRMEWQANNVAPRILMPRDTFITKVRELYAQYDYEKTPLKIAVLECISHELSSFYGVSRQSVLLRMIEAGFPEARQIYNYESTSGSRSFITESEAYLEYSSNPKFKELIDSGDFRFIEGYLVINDPRYILEREGQKDTLTDYAWENLSECALNFTMHTVSPKDRNKLPFEIFHRENGNTERSAPMFKESENAAVLGLSDELKKKRETYTRQRQAHQLVSPAKTCWEMIHELIQQRGMSKIHFCFATLLGEEVYRKAEKNIGTNPSLRTILAIACGLDLDLPTTEKLLQLAGHAFDDSEESDCLRFCITGLSGFPIEERNDFLASYGFEPLGSKERS